MATDPTNAELMRTIESLRTDIKEDLVELKSDLSEFKGRVVYRDVYEADRRAVDAKFTVVESTVQHADQNASSALSMAKWALGVLVSILLAILGLIYTVAQALP